MVEMILKLLGLGGDGGAVAGVARAAEDITLANLLLGRGFPAALALGALWYLSRQTYRHFDQSEANANFQLFRVGYMVQDFLKVAAGVAAVAAGIYHALLR